jgi:hypothetical protein
LKEIIDIFFFTKSNDDEVAPDNDNFLDISIII